MNDGKKKLPEDIAKIVTGTNLPSVIQNNLWNALGRLIGGLVDIPAGHLAAHKRKIETNSEVKNYMRKKIGEAATEKMLQDEDLINRSANNQMRHLLRSQMNRDSILIGTVKELNSEDIDEDASEKIDDDWLEIFWTIAGQKSNEDMQLFLSKILAGEIKQPGSFSPRTIQILSTLSSKEAKIFQDFCSISYASVEDPNFTFVIPGPIGSVGNNGLTEYGLSTKNLNMLEDAGLTQDFLFNHTEVTLGNFVFPFKIGEKILTSKAKRKVTLNEIKEVGTINFTQSGKELKQILSPPINEAYISEFSEWLEEYYGLIIISN